MEREQSFSRQQFEVRNRILKKSNGAQIQKILDCFWDDKELFLSRNSCLYVSRKVNGDALTDLYIVQDQEDLYNNNLFAMKLMFSDFDSWVWTLELFFVLSQIWFTTVKKTISYTCVHILGQLNN